MKHFTNLLLSLTTCCTLLFTTALTSFAADSTITFHGQSEGFSFQPGSEYTQTDLFDNFKNVMPGDKLTETITVTNKATDCDYINLYIKALAKDEKGNPLTYSEAFEAADGKDQAGITGQRDETVATMADFLAQLSMKVYNGKELIYEASPDELDGLAENVLLGTFRHGESTTLTVELEVPIELGNKYANRVGEADWIFTVEALDDPEPAEPESTEEPSDIKVDVKPTGDDSNLGLYIVLGLICIVVLLATGIYIARHHKKKEVE